VYWSIDKFLDIENGTANFDTPEFIELITELEMSKSKKDIQDNQAQRVHHLVQVDESEQFFLRKCYVSIAATHRRKAWLRQALCST
jgi:hypothetical protein